MIQLKDANFLDTTLFAGNITYPIPKIDTPRRDPHRKESVDALALLAKKGVEDFSSRKTSSNSSYSKKSSKKSLKKFTHASGSVNTTIQQSASKPITFGMKEKSYLRSDAQDHTFKSVVVVPENVVL